MDQEVTTKPKIEVHILIILTILILSSTVVLGTIGAMSYAITSQVTNTDFSCDPSTTGILLGEKFGGKTVPRDKNTDCYKHALAGKPYCEPSRTNLDGTKTYECQECEHIPKSNDPSEDNGCGSLFRKHCATIESKVGGDTTYQNRCVSCTEDAHCSSLPFAGIMGSKCNIPSDTMPYNYSSYKCGCEEDGSTEDCTEGYVCDREFAMHSDGYRDYTDHLGSCVQLGCCWTFDLDEGNSGTCTNNVSPKDCFAMGAQFKAGETCAKNVDMCSLRMGCCTYGGGSMTVTSNLYCKNWFNGTFAEGKICSR